MAVNYKQMIEDLLSTLDFFVNDDEGAIRTQIMYGPENIDQFYLAYTVKKIRDGLSSGALGCPPEQLGELKAFLVEVEQIEDFMKCFATYCEENYDVFESDAKPLLRNSKVLKVLILPGKGKKGNGLPNDVYVIVAIDMDAILKMRFRNAITLESNNKTIDVDYTPAFVGAKVGDKYRQGRDGWEKVK